MVAICTSWFGQSLELSFLNPSTIFSSDCSACCTSRLSLVRKMSSWENSCSSSAASSKKSSSDYQRSGSIKSGRTHRRLSLRALRNYPKPPLPFDPVGLEIVVIDGEDRGERLPPREVDQRGVGEVHGTVLITVHQSFDVGKVVVRDRQDGHCAGLQEGPGSGHVPGAREKVKDLGEDGGGRGQGKRESGESLKADSVPPITAIEKRQDRSGIDETLRSRVHVDVQFVPALRSGRSRPGPDSLQSCRHISWPLHGCGVAALPR